MSVRITVGERDLLEAAAAGAHTNVSDFVRRRALEAAELELLDRRVITVQAAEWEAFEAWVNAPPREIPALRALLAARPVWQD